MMKSKTFKISTHPTMRQKASRDIGEAVDGAVGAFLATIPGAKILQYTLAADLGSGYETALVGIVYEVPDPTVTEDAPAQKQEKQKTAKGK